MLTFLAVNRESRTDPGAEEQKHRIIEQFGLVGTCKGHLVQPPCHEHAGVQDPCVSDKPYSHCLCPQICFSKGSTEALTGTQSWLGTSSRVLT